ncbi:unnamed protein product, partial [Rhizophagus irregularis]
VVGGWCTKIKEQFSFGPKLYSQKSEIS